MSIALGDLEELEAMSDFSASSEGAHSERRYGTGSATSSDFSGDSESSDDDGGAKTRGSTPNSYDNDGEGSVGSEESDASGELAESSDDDADEDRDNSSDSSEDDDDAAMSTVASAQSDVRKHVAIQSIKGAAHANQASRDVSSDQAIQILSKNTFARSDADAEALLEWVLSVRFFQENARSSFVRNSLTIRTRGQVAWRPSLHLCCVADAKGDM